jgi:hypothetical protein
MPETALDLNLTCHLVRLPDRLRLHYAVDHRGQEDVYVLDVLPGIDAETRAAVADERSFYLCRAGGAARVLKGVPPLPAGPAFSVRVMPLGTRLSLGESLQRVVDLLLPLREQNPCYYPPADPEHCDPVDIKELWFNVHVLGGKAEGFYREPVAFAPGYWHVWADDTMARVATLEARLPVSGVRLRVRKDDFTRLN